MNIQEAIGLFIDHVYSTRAENTALSYKQGIKCFVEILQEYGIETSAPLSNVTMDIFVRTPAWLMRNYTKTTASARLYAIKYFMNWMVLENHLEPDYRDSLRYQTASKQLSMKHGENMPRWPEDDDVEKMREAARILKYASPIKERNIALVEFLAGAGCRVSEACNLKIKDIDSKFRSAIVKGKGQYEYRVYISTQAREAMQLYWEMRGFADRNNPAFARHDKKVGWGGKKFKIKPIGAKTAENIVSEIASVAGIEQFTPHYFRHGFAITVLKETGNLALVQDLLGHKSPVSTRAYAKIRPTELEQAHKDIFG